MGTRHFTSIILNGDQKICQYGQWDGYPTYAGARILEFLRDCDLNHLKETIKNTFITQTSFDLAHSYTGSNKVYDDIYRRVVNKQRELNRSPEGEWYNIYNTTIHMLKEAELSVSEADILLPSTRDTGTSILSYIYNRDLTLPPLEIYAIDEEYTEVGAFAARECASKVPGCDAQGYYVVDLDKRAVFMNFNYTAWHCNLDDLPQDIDRTMALFEARAMLINLPETEEEYLKQIQEHLKDIDQPELTANEIKQLLADLIEPGKVCIQQDKPCLAEQIESAATRSVSPSITEKENKEHTR